MPHVQVEQSSAQQHAVTSRGPLDDLLDEVWAAGADADGGALATYIPELAKADPTVFGLALATLDGRVYTAGRIAEFTVQSVSKPFVYALALADRGEGAVLAKVGVEPTGNPFNTISVDDGGRAFNPMVNAGAIITTSLVGGDDRDAQHQRVLDGLSAFAGRRLTVDESVYESERLTGDRNRAIAYLLRSVGALEDDVEGALDLYFRQCAVQVTARDLAVMAGTLANGGVNPVTGDVVVPASVVEQVLTVMSTCGMYDYAGEWLYRVGLPAKSGVSGGVAAVQPGRLGVGAHSPLLDQRGNSVRAVAACEQLSRRLGLHVFAPGGPGVAAGHRMVRGDALRSKRVRAAAEIDVLDARGREIVVHELLGTVDVAATERLLRAVVEDAVPATARVLDLRKVRSIGAASVGLLVRLVEQLTAQQVDVAVVLPRSPVARRDTRGLVLTATTTVADLDDALQWSEDRVLAEAGLPDEPPDGLVPLADHDLLRGLGARAVAAVEAAAETRVFTPGATIFSEGDAADGLYFVAAGRVSARIGSGSGHRRLSTMAAGSAFGEVALVEGGTRSTMIVADEPTLCHVITSDAFERLVTDDPATASEVYRAVARSLSARLRRATREIAALEA